MSKQNWAAIVYGRSYHLDFRFITIPHDFTTQEIAWSSPYILATTQQARNLSSYPRWSLFKNDFYCIVGITCMVRDLFGTWAEKPIETMTKDDQGRPLYIFVGYVTQLSHDRNLTDFPAYTGEDLTGFQSLYQEVEKVWLVRDYDNHQALKSEYKPLSNSVDLATPSFEQDDNLSLNNQAKHPDKIFLWHPQQNNWLWWSSAQCAESTSVCLDIKGTCLLNSPFLNQSIPQLEQFTVQDRIVTGEQSGLRSDSDQTSFSFKQKISNKAKEDLDITLQHAARVTLAGQELIDNLTNKSNSRKNIERSLLAKNTENFGFKIKKKPSLAPEKKWF